MRTTIRLADDLLRDAKMAAAESGITLTRLIEEALRERLSRRKRVLPPRRRTLPTFKGQGLRPGVDLDDTRSLLDLMERRDDPA